MVRVGDVYRRTGLDMFMAVGVIRTGDIGIVANVHAWCRILIPRIGRYYDLPISHFENQHFWEKVDHEKR